MFTIRIGRNLHCLGHDGKTLHKGKKLQDRKHLSMHEILILVAGHQVQRGTIFSTHHLGAVVDLEGIPDGKQVVVEEAYEVGASVR